MQHSASILLIGDEPNILKTLRQNLTSRGYEVSLALDDVEACQMASTGDYSGVGEVVGMSITGPDGEEIV